MVGNLAGFESSIRYYWNAQCTFLVTLPILYAIILPFFHPQPVSLNKKLIVGSIVMVLFIAGTACNRQNLARKVTPEGIKYTLQTYIPFYIPQAIDEHRKYAKGLILNKFDINNYYIRYHSLISYFPAMLITAIEDRLSENYVPTGETLEKTINYQADPHITPTKNIIVILVESFESFALEAKDMHGNYLMPYMHTLAMGQHTLFADKIKCQVTYGGSSDGQLLCQTGLLPLQSGAAAKLFPDNEYPNYAHLFDYASVLNPCEARIWNQGITTYSYGYDTLLNRPAELTDRWMYDNESFKRLDNILEQSNASFCHLLITCDSHTPFEKIPIDDAIAFDPEMPNDLKKYLNCIRETDRAFGEWFTEWQHTKQAQNTVVVITGDHTIHKDAILEELATYAKKVDWSIQSGKTYCPLIIFDATLTQNTYVPEMCYQMDIYPTIMHLIGAERYYWKGFGVNLLDSTVRKNRIISEIEAYNTSNDMIRCNYFTILPDSIK